jgi:uncharacterized membrane protein YkvA (DUF1232 family)
MGVSLRERVRALRADTYTLYLVARDARTPWHAKLLAVVVVGYALSPIDLIPDFIPVLGYLDDLILIPLGIWLALKLVPPEVITESRARAASALEGELPVNRTAAVVIVLVWVVCAALLVAWIYSAVFGRR